MACCPVCGKKMNLRRLHTSIRANYIFCSNCNARLVVNRKSQVQIYLIIVILTTLPCILFGKDDSLCGIGGILMLFLLLIAFNFFRFDKKE